MSNKSKMMTPLERLIYEKQVAEKCLQLDMVAMEQIDSLNHRHPSMRPLNMALRVDLRKQIERCKVDIRKYEARIRALQPKLI